MELSNATLTNIEGVQAQNPDLTITVNRSDLNRVMMGVNTFDDLIKEGKATFVGDRKPFDAAARAAGAVLPDVRDPAGHGSVAGRKDDPVDVQARNGAAGARGVTADR